MQINCLFLNLMSSLSYLLDYGSESENSDYEVEIKRIKLPVPDLSKVPVVSSETHADDPLLHDGRTRSFPHIRGNWASYVYIQFPEEDSLLKVIDNLEERLLSYNKLWQKCDDFHVSVSKTFVLNYHLIKSFTLTLQKAITSLESFELDFNGLKVYCNEDKTRTFLALQVEYSSHNKLLQLTKKVDEVLTGYKLPTFYEDSSFHMSIFWINGNQLLETTNILEDLNEVVYKESEENLKTILINQVNCKTGNKYFRYCLQ